jgi:beta-phosphoglucomutase
MNRAAHGEDDEPTSLVIPDLGCTAATAGFVPWEECDGGTFRTGRDGVRAILGTTDGKLALVVFADHTLVFVDSALGYPAYYPLRPVKLQRPVRAVLMDLDGTSVHSEQFWIWMIQKSIASLLGNEAFALEDADLPYVSGHSVSEHLQYCIGKYCPGGSLEEARQHYFRHTRFEMREIMEGRGRQGAFTPAPGLKPFLLAAKERGLKLGLVTSGLHEKAWPEILSAFRELDLGDPAEFYDAIITAGFPLGKGLVGTLGELSPKPHPWLYAETCCVGLGIPVSQRNQVVGIEDSSAGVCAVRLAGFPVIGVAGGNILEGGARALCDYFVDSLDEVLPILVGRGEESVGQVA